MKGVYPADRTSELPGGVSQGLQNTCSYITFALNPCYTTAGERLNAF